MHNIFISSLPIKIKSQFTFILWLFICISIFPQQYNHLVLEGGGVKGIAYCGAFEILEQNKLLDSIKLISGTSAGSVQATALAIGYNSQEIATLISTTKYQQFNDGACGFVGGIYRLNKYYGWYKGEAFRNWLDKIIYFKTGIHNTTFIQLDSLVKTNKKFKKLQIVVTDLIHQQSVVLNSSSFPTMCIADAVRASSAVPFYFEPLIINSKGAVQKKVRYDSDLLLVDGGMLANFPWFIGDFSSGKVLGIILDMPKDTNRIANCGHPSPILIKNKIDFFNACYFTLIENQMLRNWNADFEKNIIRINTGKIKPKLKKMSDAEIKELLNNGRNAARRFMG